MTVLRMVLLVPVPEICSGGGELGLGEAPITLVVGDYPVWQLALSRRPAGTPPSALTQSKKAKEFLC
jgi:hypothetical protein